MKHALVILSLLLTFVASSLSQERFEQNDPRMQRSPISYEAVALVRSDSGKGAVNIHYRIGQSFFVYVRDESAPGKNQYTARGELIVELLNENKASVARSIRQLPLTRTSIPRESDRDLELEGTISLSAPPGTYTIVFSVDDRESGRSFMEKTRKVTLPNPGLSDFQVASMFFARTPQSDDSHVRFTPVNRGGNVLFGEAGGIAVELRPTSETDTLAIHWTLTGKEDGIGERKRTFGGSNFSVFNNLIGPPLQEPGVSYDLGPAIGKWKTLFIPLSLEKLEPGKYRFEVEFRQGPIRKEQSHEFYVVWPSRPFSLMDPDLALDALRYIASDSEMEAIQSGPAEKRGNAFYEFWRGQSKDTTTAYSVPMAEYYYRVDEAMRKFSTTRENDGYKTDRGRIYILYGPPTKSERLLQPDSAPTEIWTYDRLHRRFIFLDPAKNGNYILSQAENI